MPGSGGVFQTGFAVGRNVDRVKLPPEIVGHRSGNARVVFDDENSHEGAAGRSPRRECVHACLENLAYILHFCGHTRASTEAEMSSISSSSSATSGTLGHAPPVSFPGVSSGIDYDAIIEKYTADTLLQEKPAQAQVMNLNAQTAAILKLSSLAGSVADALTQLSDPALMNAFSAKAGNTASGYAVASAAPIAGETPVPGTYVINAQTAATSSVILNNPLANGALDTTVSLDRAGTAISVSNGSASNGKVTVNGVLLNFDASTQTIGDVVAELDTALASSNGGSAVLNANGTVTLTGVLTLGSGAIAGTCCTCSSSTRGNWRPVS